MMDFLPQGPLQDWISVSLGLVILLLAGDALVKGAVNLSLRLGVPALIVSLTIVAFGTSAPELLVAIQAITEGVPGIALGNVCWIEHCKRIACVRHSGAACHAPHERVQHTKILCSDAHCIGSVHRSVFLWTDRVVAWFDPFDGSRVHDFHRVDGC